MIGLRDGVLVAQLPARKINELLDFYPYGLSVLPFGDLDSDNRIHGDAAQNMRSCRLLTDWMASGVGWQK